MAGFSESKKKINNQRTTAKTLKGYVLGDALICLGKAIRKLGFEVEEVERFKMGFAGPIAVPFVHYSTANGVDVPYGDYKLDDFGVISPTFMGEDEDDPVPELMISIKFERGADETKWDELLRLFDEEAKVHTSLFRGKAIRITQATDMIIPHLIEVDSPHDLFLNPDVEEEIRNNLIFPIAHADEVKAIGVKPQRGVLLHGKYGTGKSLIAYWAAQESVKVGRTFVLCKTNMLEVAIPVSRFLQPSTLFIEDMDEMGGNGGLSHIRNMLSGVENKKGYDTMTIMTTNFLDQVIRMDRSLLRPERIDAIIEITPPTKAIVQKLVEFHANGWLKEGEDWDKAYTALAHQQVTPAVLIEMLNRVKIAALQNGRIISLAMLEKAAIQMDQQITLSDPVKPNPDTTPQLLAKSLYGVMRGQLT